MGKKQCKENWTAIPYTSEHLWNVDIYGIPEGPCFKCGKLSSEWDRQLREKLHGLSYLPPSEAGKNCKCIEAKTSPLSKKVKMGKKERKHNLFGSSCWCKPSFKVEEYSTTITHHNAPSEKMIEEVKHYPDCNSKIGEKCDCDQNYQTKENLICVGDGKCPLCQPKTSSAKTAHDEEGEKCQCYSYRTEDNVLHLIQCDKCGSKGKSYLSQPPTPKVEKWESQEPIGDYHLKVGSNPIAVILVHKDGSTWSDPTRAMSHLLTELSTAQAKAKREGVEELIKRIEYEADGAGEACQMSEGADKGACEEANFLVEVLKYLTSLTKASSKEEDGR